MRLGGHPLFRGFGLASQKVSGSERQRIHKLDQCTNDHLWSRGKYVKQTARTVYPRDLHACGFGTNYVKWIRGDEPNRSNGMVKPIRDVPVHFWRWFVHFYLVNTYKSLEIGIELCGTHDRGQHGRTSI